MAGQYNPTCLRNLARPPRLSKYTLVLSVLALAVFQLPSRRLLAHQFEDGFVERAVAIVVRPDKTTIEYSIGANEVTRQCLMDYWSGETSSEKDQIPAKNASTTVDAPFVEAVGQAIARRLVVAADGNPVAIELVEVIPTPRHHVEATVVLRFNTPQPAAGKKSVELTFEDRNFFLPTAEDTTDKTDQTDKDEPSPVPLGGAFRYAFKATSGAMLNRSTVAPLLVRAQRLEDADLTTTQLKEHMRFGGDVILPANK